MLITPILAGIRTCEPKTFDHIFDQNQKKYSYFRSFQVRNFTEIKEIIQVFASFCIDFSSLSFRDKDAASSSLATRTNKNGCFRKKSAVFLTFYAFFVSAAHNLTTYYFFTFSRKLQTFFLWKYSLFFI